MNHYTPVFPALSTQLTGQSLVSHAGLSVLTSFLNAVGFRQLCEDRFSQFVPAAATHRPGKILGALALSLAAGGEQATDIDQLRAAPGLFGPVASDATISRFMNRIKEQPEAFEHGFATMTRTLRTKVWAAAGPRNPGRLATPANPLIIDIDNRIKTLKNTGLGKLPYWSFAANQAWANLAMFALNLVSWLQLVVLPGGHEAGCWDVKRWRYRLFSMAGKIVSGGRQRRLLIPESAPEAQLLCQLIEGIDSLFQRWRHGLLAA